MIAKQTVGQDFHGILSYVGGKHGARRICGNIAGETTIELVDEFRVSERLNANVNRPVYHVSLALPKSDALSDREWRRFITRYLDGMGFSENQYVGFMHTDTDDVHVHVIASRVRITDGRCVRDSWNFRRSESLLRELEQSFGLTPVASSSERRTRSPKTGEVRFMRRTGKESVRVTLQRHIREALIGRPTLDTFRRRLAAHDVETRLRLEDEGTRFTGISFALDGIAVPGRALGRDFSWPMLQTALSPDEMQREEYGGARDLPTGSETLKPHEAENQATVTKEGAMQKRKQRLRDRYLRYERLVRDQVVVQRIERRALDIAIAILIVRDYSDRHEGIRIAQETLTQSDEVRSILVRELPDERKDRAARYIQDVTDAATQALQERQHSQLALE